MNLLVDRSEPSKSPKRKFSLYTSQRGQKLARRTESASRGQVLNPTPITGSENDQVAVKPIRKPRAFFR